MMILGLSLSTQASFQFGKIIARGSGCPNGTTQIIKTPDQQAMSLLFDQLMAEVPQYDNDNDNDEVTGENPRRGRKDNVRLDHKVCTIVINANIKANQRVESLDISLDMRGMATTTPGTAALFKTIFLQWDGPKRESRKIKREIVRKIWRNHTDKEWTISQHLPIQVKSQCSKRQDKKVKFILRNILMAKMKKGIPLNDASALLTVDSADLLGKLKVKIKTAPCRGGLNPRPPRPPRRPSPRPRPRRPRPRIGGRIPRPGIGRRAPRCPRGTIWSPRKQICRHLR